MHSRAPSTAMRHDAVLVRSRTPPAAAASRSSCTGARSRCGRRPIDSNGPLDQRLAGLGQHLDRDVVRDQVLLDELADEVEVGLGRRREADLDLLVAHAHQQVEHPQLAAPGSSGRSAPGCRRAGRRCTTRGAFVMTCVGQVRSGRSTGVNGLYLWIGIWLGRCAMMRPEESRLLLIAAPRMAGGGVRPARSNPATRRPAS